MDGSGDQWTIVCSRLEHITPLGYSHMDKSYMAIPIGTWDSD